MWWLFLLGCGGGDDEAPAEAAPVAVAAVDSPFCASFEACLEGLPGWAPDCDRWWAGDPDCSDLDFSAGPADWYDETSRGIAALRSPGIDEDVVVLEEIFTDEKAVTEQKIATEPKAVTEAKAVERKTAPATKGERK
jgi:hypothetical protein